MSTIAVFLVIGGASALAAAQLGKNTVGSKQLKKNAVTSAKIKNNAVTSAKIKDGAVANGKLAGSAVTSDKLADGAVTEGKIAANAVTGAKVKDGSLTGADIQQGSLNAVKAANIYSTEFDEGPNALVNPSDPGIKAGGCFLVCAVEFPRSVSGCSASATPVGIGGGSGEPAFAEVFTTSEPQRLLVEMWDKGGSLTAHDFTLTVICPSTS
jgi:hypothetical protein